MVNAALTLNAVVSHFNLFKCDNSTALAGQPSPVQKFFLLPVTRPWKDDLQSRNLLL